MKIASFGKWFISNAFIKFKIDEKNATIFLFNFSRKIVNSIFKFTKNVPIKPSISMSFAQWPDKSYLK